MSVIQGGEDEEPRRGGLDPGVPQVLTAWRVTGPVSIGHTADFHDQDAPIIVREGTAIMPGPDGTDYADTRCRGCVAHLHIARGEDETLLVLEHERGCPEMAALLRQAGVAR
jgi:hypothetical protein